MQHPFFLQSVADRLLAKMNEGKEVALVLPNRRAGLYVKKYLAKAIDKPTFLPIILTIEELMSKISGLLKMESVQQLVTLFDAYREVEIGDDTFSKFLTWAPTFIKDCNDIDNSLADPDTFFQVLYEDREIRNWELGKSHTELQKSYLEFWKEAHTLYAAFVRRLEEQGASYAGLSYRQAIQNIVAGTYTMPYDWVIFAGFNALNNAEERLIDHVISSNKGEALWDLDAYYVDDKEMKAGEYFRKYLQQWPQSVPPDRLGYRTDTINIIESQGSTAQCDVVYKILKKIESTDYRSQKIAVILTDESLLEPLLLRLPETMGSYNITMGKPLRDFGVFYLFERLLYFYSRSTVAHMSTLDVLSILSSPYINILDRTDVAQRIRQYINKENVHACSVQDLDHLLGKSIWRQILSIRRTPTDVLAYLDKLIHRLRAHYIQVGDEASIEVLFECRNIVNQLTTVYADNSAYLDNEHLHKLYLQVGSMVRLPYEGEPLQGIQIMGLLESRGLDFDHVILVSANEGLLPESKASNTFIPHVFRKYFKMPTYDQRDTIFAYSFYRLLHQSKRLDIIYNGLSASDGGGELSRYVQQIQSEFHGKTSRTTKIRSMASYYTMTARTEREYRIDKTPEVIADIRTYLHEKALSPSSINTLIRSPLDFYLEKIAKVREPDLLESQMKANTFGTIIHNTLDELYQPLVGSTLTQDSLDAMMPLVETVLDKHRAAEFRSGNITRGYNYLMRSAASRLVREVILMDKKLIEHSEIRIIALEEELRSTIEVDLSDGEQMEVDVRGFVDRIQWCDDTIEIIDYKTGGIPDSLSARSLDQVGVDYKRDKLLQLLVYAWLFDDNPPIPDHSLAQLRPALLGLKSWQKGLLYIGNGGYSIDIDDLHTLKVNIADRIRELLDAGTALTPETEAARMQYSNYLGVYSL